MPVSRIIVLSSPDEYKTLEKLFSDSTEVDILGHGYNFEQASELLGLNPDIILADWDQPQIISLVERLGLQLERFRLIALGSIEAKSSLDALAGHAISSYLLWPLSAKKLTECIAQAMTMPILAAQRESGAVSVEPVELLVIPDMPSAPLPVIAPLTEFPSSELVAISGAETEQELSLTIEVSDSIGISTPLVESSDHPVVSEPVIVGTPPLPVKKQPILDVAFVEEPPQSFESNDPPIIPIYKDKKKGKLIAIYGGKGGVGKTTIAANLSLAMSMLLGSTEVAIIDLNLQFGHLALHFGAAPASTNGIPATFRGAVDLLKEKGSITQEEMNGLLTMARGSVWLLAAPTFPEEADLCNGRHVEYVLNCLLTIFSYVIVDCSSGLSDITLTALERADSILLVTDLSVSSIRDTGLAIRAFPAIGVKEEILHLVINQSGESAGITLADLQKEIKIPGLTIIPNQPKFFRPAETKGVPVMESGGSVDLTRRFKKAAEVLIQQLSLVEQ